MFSYPFDERSLCLSDVGCWAVIAGNFVDSVGLGRWRRRSFSLGESVSKGGVRSLSYTNIMSSKNLFEGFGEGRVVG